MSKFLNNEGLLYLWGKIKTYVTGALPKKVSELENDSKFITLSDVPEGAAASNTVPKANGTASAAGKSGLVPAPAAGAQAKYLRGDGTWGTPTNTTYKDATQSTAGLLSTADKKKLDAFGEASTYATKEDVTKQIADAGHIKKQIVESLPAASAAADNVIYMVAKKTANGDNAYDEYMLVSGKLEHIGDTQADIETLTTDDIDALIAQAQ